MRPGTTRRPQREPGFTLLELLIVMVVIGIIIVFILVAARDGIRRSEERATQALISKIEAGLVDRLDALTSTRADYNAAHSYIAAIWPNVLSGAALPYGPYNTPFIPDQPGSVVPAGIPRAAVIAQFDRIKAEMPDVFAIQNDGNYPFNFAATPYLGGQNGTGVLTNGYDTYLLPIGVSIVNDLTIPSYGGNPSPLPRTPSNQPIFPNSTGIFGASYTAIGGLTKQLAQQLSGSPNWYDGTDNNGNGLIDELGESGLTAATVGALLSNHTHKTARAETLYAVLVSGVGPLGSVFSPDDFSDREVKDTDGDGLLEFVDAWGEPLQFYRWPVLYYGRDPNDSDLQLGVLGSANATVQRGWLGYANATVNRDQNPLDPNQQLVAPQWWSGIGTISNNAGPYPASGPLSGGANLFQQFFIPLLDPFTNPSLGTAPNPTLWDRGVKFYQRRAYFSKPLILSSGPDKIAGVPRVDSAYYQILNTYAAQKSFAGMTVGNGTGLTGTTPGYLYQGTPNSDTPWLLLESLAAQYTINRSADVYQTPPPATDKVNTAITAAIVDVGGDDITNQNISGPGGAIQ